MTLQLLAVSADTEFVTEFAEQLGCLGFAVDTGSRGQDALDRCREVDAVFLDLVLADVDGFEACRAIRMVSDVPVIMLSARDDEFDRVLSLRLGADDYIARPYSLRELTARTEAVVRRARNCWAPFAAQRATEHEAGVRVGFASDPTRPERPERPERAEQPERLRIDLQRRSVSVHGREVPLTRKEFDILALLFSAPDRVFTRERIMTEVWGHDGAGDTRTLGVHMSGLRKKLGLPALIETVRGVGFRLAVPGAASTAAPAAASESERKAG